MDRTQEEHAISIRRGVTMAKRDARLKALKVRNFTTPADQRPFGDGDLNRIMDPDLYEATKNGDADKFIDALEEVSESRRLALSLIFDQVTPSGNSLLHVAASSGKEDVMELTLNHFPYLATRKNSLEDTPVHVAIQHQKLNATEMLIGSKGNSEVVFWKNRDSKSPLYLAAETGDKRILQLLLETSAQDKTYADKIQGMSPVFAAVEGKSGLLEDIIDRLPKLLQVKGEDGGTPLHYAASLGNVQAVKLLLRNCRYLALQADKNGSYPIHIACESGHVDATHELAKMWPDLAEIKNKKGQNILHVAAKGGNNKVVQYILTKCGQFNIEELVNSKDVDGNTPLHLASKHNRCHVLRSLTREKRSDLRLQNNEKLTALDVAMESGSLSTKNPVLLGRAILIAAGVPRSEGRDIPSLREQSSGSSKSSRLKWMRDQINTRLLVATLVASVTFTAGFTLPGGYNSSTDRDPGMATMLQNRVFQLFIIFDTLAMYSSTLAVVVLLGGHVDDYYRAERAYRKAGPLLLMAVTGMTMAFSAAIVVAVSKLNCLVKVVLWIGVPYMVMLIMFLLSLIFPISYTVMFLSSIY